jgi:hypothetical protein
MSKQGKAAYWALEENKEAIRLNFGIKQVQECYVTSDEQYLLLTN